MYHRLGLQVSNRSIVLRVVSVKSDPLGPMGLPSVKFDLPLDHLDTNDLVGGTPLKFYQSV
jgi:hypothetical protein